MTDRPRVLRLRWPRRRMLLWHPDSPGGRVTVDVLWPRYLWVDGPDEDGRPQDLATLGEVLRMYRERKRVPASESNDGLKGNR